MSKKRETLKSIGERFKVDQYRMQCITKYLHQNRDPVWISKRLNIDLMPVLKVAEYYNLVFISSEEFELINNQRFRNEKEIELYVSGELYSIDELEGSELEILNNLKYHFDNTIKPQITTLKSKM